MSVVAARVYLNRVEIAADSILVFGASKRTDNFIQLYFIIDFLPLFS